VVGSNSLVYSLAFVGSGAVANDWNTFTADANTSTWFIYGNGAPGGTVGKTLTEWLADTTYGAILSGGSIVAQGFNIGSSQRLCRVGIDWLESSILNNGNRIDFITPPTVWYVNDNSTTGDVYTSSTGDNANNGSASAPFATIAYAITQASAGDIIRVDAGTYTENVNVNKRVILVGAGIDQTIVTAATGSVPTITVSASGSSVEDRLVIRDMKVTGATGLINPGSGILVQSVSAQSNLTIESVDASFNGGPGIAFNGTPSISDVVIKKSNLSNNANAGIRIASAVASFNGLLVDSCTINNNASIAFSYNPDGNVSNTGTNFTISNTTFNNNSTAGVTNAHDLALFTFRGNATLSNVTVTSGNGSTQNSNSYGISIDGGSGNGPLGTVTLDNVTVQGHVGKGALLFQRYTEISGVSMNNVDLSNCVAPWGQLILSHTDADAFAVGNTTLKSLALWTTGGADATTAQFKNISTGTALDRSVLEDCFQIENQVAHKIDVAALGFARVKAGEVFVTPTSFAAPTTTTPSIQRGVDAATAGDILHVAAATFTENVTIGKALDVRGANYGVVANDPSAPATLNPARNAESILSGTFLVQSNDISIDGFAITGNSFAVQAPGTGQSNIVISNNDMYSNTGGRTIEYWSSAQPASNWTITGNRITDVQATDATAITLFNITDLTIADNTILHTNSTFNGRRGLNIDGCQNVVIANNNVDMGLLSPLSDNSDGAFTKARYPLQLSASATNRAVSNITVSNNTMGGAYDGIITLGNGTYDSIAITGNEISNNVIGIRFQAGTNTPTGSQSNISILNNSISTSNRPIYLQNGTASSGTADAYNNVTISNNSLLRSSVGAVLEVQAGSILPGGAIAATCNWFGSASDVASKVVGDAVFTPYLVSGTDNDALAPGFQPEPGSCIGLGLTALSESTDALCSEGSGSISVTISGGLAPYSINWGTDSVSVSDTSYTISGLAAGVYSISVTDSLGSVISLTDTISEPDAIFATAQIESEIYCNGGTAIVGITADGGTAPYQYTFDGNTNSTGFFGGIAAGANYAYSVTDANGCPEATGTLSVTEPSVLEVSSAVVSTVVSCNGGVGEVTITATGGIPPYTYSFNGTSNATGVFTGVLAGEDQPYSVTDNESCGPVTGSITVEQPTLITSSATVSICENSLPYNVNDTTLGSSGVYVFTLQAGNGCDSIYTLNFTVLSNTASTTTLTICESAYPYTWNGETFTEPGTYLVTLTNAAGCDSLATLNLSTFPGGPAVSTNPVADSRCNRGPVSLSVTPPAGATVDWFTAASGGSLLALGSPTLNIPDLVQTTTYYARSRNTTTGCISSERVAVTASVTVVPVPDGINASRCDEGTLVLTAIPNETFATQRIEWYDQAIGGNLVGTGTTFETPVLSATTSYFAQAIDTIGGCTSISRKEVIARVSSSPETPTSANDFLRCDPGTLTLSAFTASSNATIFWYADEIGGTPLRTFSNTFVTPILSETTIYYAEAISLDLACASPRIPVTATIASIPEDAITVDVSRCGPGVFELSIEAPTGVTADWYTASRGGTLLAEGTLSYTTPELSATTAYFIATRNIETGCTSGNRTRLNAVINPVPAVISTVPGQVCGEGTVNLKASTGVGATIDWFADETATELLVDGGTLRTVTLATPAISSTTTYYARARNTTTGCTSETVAVIASVNDRPTIVESFPGSRCGAGSVELSATASDDAVITWHISAITNSALATGATFNTPLLSASRVYFAQARDTVTGCTSASRTEVLATINPAAATPVAPAVTSSCGSQTVTLTVSVAPGHQISWYESAVGGSPIAENTASVDILVEQSTYYAESISESTGCVSARVPVTITFTNAPPAPLGTDGSVCVSGRVSLSAAALPGNVVRWYSVATGGSILATGDTYLTPSLTETTVFYAESFNTSTGCVSTSRTAVNAVVNANPAPFETATFESCGPGEVALALTAEQGITADWYTRFSGGDLLAEGTLSYTTPVLSATTLYYAAARNSATGCISTRVAVIAQINALPLITGTIPGAVCGEGSATLRASAGAGATIDWFADEACTELLVDGGILRTVSLTTPSITATTTYYARARNTTTGCVSVPVAVAATVNERPLVTESFPGSRCGAGSVELSATASDNAVITWHISAITTSTLFTGSTYNTPSIAGSRVYFAQARDTITGCTSLSRTEVAATVNPAAALPVAQGSTSSCGQDSITLTVSVAAGHQIFWFAEAEGGSAIAENTNSILVSTSGQLTYYAESISENTGCVSARTPVTIIINDALDAPTGVDGAICVRGRVSLSATAPAGAVVRWFSVTEGGTVLSTANTYLTPTLTETTVYYAESFNSSTGCISQVRTPVTATVNANPAPLASVTIGRCGPGTVELTVESPAGITADWYTASRGGSPIAVNTLSYTTPSISSTTNYFVAARDLSTGCVSARVSVRAQINPFPAVLETVPGSVCGEGTATLRATTATGSTIDWFADEACTELLLDGGTLRIVPLTTPVISANTTFYARARNRTTGCLSEPVAVAATVNARPEILAVYDGISCSSGSVLLSVDVSPNATADWFATPTTTTRLVTGSTLFLTPVISSSRTYYAVARNVFTGCTSSRVAVQAVIDAAACKVDDTVVDDQTEIENDLIEEPSLRLDVDYQLKAYPNPTTGLTQVEWISKEADKVYIRLYNSLGQIAYEYTDFAETGINVYRIDLSDVSQGMYYLSITNGKDVIKTQPLVKN
jgi:hypothetical protein